jgi:acid phosphatase type 7
VTGIIAIRYLFGYLISMGNWQALGGIRDSKIATVVIVAFVAVLVGLGCGSEQTTSPPKQTSSPPEQTSSPPVVVAAGDIADCRTEGDGATARLVDDIQGTVLTLGDNAYPDGSAEDFEECYDPTWGRFKDRTKPSPGNHDYHAQKAEGYFEYFGKAAGDPDKGYYSYDLGDWHLLSLNSNCEEVGCEASSAQVRWLKADLAANADKPCALAYMHHPRFSSGAKHGSTYYVKPLWEALHEEGADVVLSAHEHNYERFVPQNPGGRADPERGIRQFVVGTGGGKSTYPIFPILGPIANSEVHDDDTYGVLKLKLRPESYEWRFVPAEGGEFTDSGNARCH